MKKYSSEMHQYELADPVDQLYIKLGKLLQCILFCCSINCAVAKTSKRKAGPPTWILDRQDLCNVKRIFKIRQELVNIWIFLPICLKWNAPEKNQATSLKSSCYVTILASQSIERKEKIFSQPSCRIFTNIQTRFWIRDAFTTAAKQLLVLHFCP